MARCFQCCHQVAPSHLSTKRRTVQHQLTQRPHQKIGDHADEGVTEQQRRPGTMQPRRATQEQPRPDRTPNRDHLHMTPPQRLLITHLLGIKAMMPPTAPLGDCRIGHQNSLSVGIPIFVCVLRHPRTSGITTSGEVTGETGGTMVTLVRAVPGQLAPPGRRVRRGHMVGPVRAECVAAQVKAVRSTMTSPRRRTTRSGWPGVLDAAIGAVRRR